MATRQSSGETATRPESQTTAPPPAAPPGGEDPATPATTRERAAGMPFAGLAAFPALREEMERMTRQFFGNDWMQGMSRMHPLTMDWPAFSRAMPFATLSGAPRSAMSESDGGYEITVELPGMDEKDVELTLSDNTLLLEAEKSDEREGGEKDFHFTERSYGSIRRRFPLPRDVDANGMKASFAKGVLTVTLPKTEAAKRTQRRIPVSGG